MVNKFTYKDLVDMIQNLAPYTIHTVCYNCYREVPNKNDLTKNGCVWCDREYHKGVKNG